MINIFKNFKNDLPNKYLNKRMESYLKINARNPERYNNIKYMGVDGKWHSVDYNNSSEENINTFINLMPTLDTMLSLKDRLEAKANFEKNYTDLNHFTEVDLDLSEFPEEEQDKIRQIIINSISNPQYNIDDLENPDNNTKVWGNRPVICPENDKILVYDRSIDLGHNNYGNGSISQKNAFNNKYHMKAQCQQINKALSEAGYSYRVKASIMNNEEPNKSNKSELETINKENENLKKQISELRNNYKELSDNAKKIFNLDENNVGNRVAKKKEENRNKSLTL